MCAAIGWLWCAQGFALGTPSNTVVTNNVTVDHNISGVPQVQLSDSVQFRVDNKVDVSLAVTNNTVSPSQLNQVITFVISNDGNTTQGFALSAANSSLADNFDMNNVRLFIETGGVAGFDPTDIPYTSGSGTSIGDVLADSTITVYLVADVPPTGGGSAPADGSTARYDLLVTTLNAGTNTITTSDAASAWNNNSVQVVFAEGSAGPHPSDSNNDGKLSAAGTFAVNAPALAFAKVATIVDPLGGNLPVTGATITYTLTINVSGSGTVDNVIVTDPVPANTTYVTGSLDLNSAALSDGADADAGDFNITNANSITVDLGNLTSASGNQVITFAVTIN